MIWTGGHVVKIVNNILFSLALDVCSRSSCAVPVCPELGIRSWLVGLLVGGWLGGGGYKSLTYVQRGDGAQRGPC